MSPDEKIIERIVSPPPKSIEEKREEFNAFKNNIDLLTGSSSIIKENFEYYYIIINSIHIGLAYLGGYNIPLGALLELWEQGILVDQCDQCLGKLYIYKAAGSPLSGSNTCYGICLECRGVSKKSLASTRQLIQAFKFIKSRQNIQRVKFTKRQYFSFAKGLDGQPDTEKVIKNAVIPVTILQLIDRLS